LSNLDVPARNTRALLLVEDEPLIAAGIAQLLEEHGYEFVQSAYTYAEAEEAVGSGRFDGAILDVMLATRYVWPIAAALRDRGTPFLFLTGLEVGSIDEAFRDAPVVFKPFTEHELVSKLDALMSFMPS